MRLSSRSLLFAALTALLALLAAWGADPIGVWRVALGLLLVGLLFEYLIAGEQRLGLQVTPAHRAELGRPLAFEAQLRSASSLPALVRYRLQAPPGMLAVVRDHELRLAPGETATCDVQALPVRLGALEFPDQALELRGFLGLAHWIRREPVACSVRVAPGLIREGTQLAGRVTGSGRRAPTIGEGTDVFAVREWRDGDRANRIDWKATARRAKPVVREMERHEDLELVLMVDCGLSAGVVQDSLSHFGHACNAAAQLAELACRNGDRVGLLLFADRVLARLAPRRGQAQLAAIHQALSSHDALEAESNPLAATLEVRTLLRRRGLIVLFSDLDDPDGSDQMVAATALLRPVHLPLIAAVRDEESEALISARAEDWQGPWHAIAAEEVRRSNVLVRRHLARLGAEVVHVPTQVLSERVCARYAELRRRHRV